MSGEQQPQQPPPPLLHASDQVLQQLELCLRGSKEEQLRHAEAGCGASRVSGGDRAPESAQPPRAAAAASCARRPPRARAPRPGGPDGRSRTARQRADVVVSRRGWMEACKLHGSGADVWTGIAGTVASAAPRVARQPARIL